MPLLEVLVLAAAGTTTIVVGGSLWLARVVVKGEQEALKREQEIDLIAEKKDGEAEGARASVEKHKLDLQHQEYLLTNAATIEEQKVKVVEIKKSARQVGSDAFFNSLARFSSAGEVGTCPFCGRTADKMASGRDFLEAAVQGHDALTVERNKCVRAKLNGPTGPVAIYTPELGHRIYQGCGNCCAQWVIQSTLIVKRKT